MAAGTRGLVYIILFCGKKRTPIEPLSTRTTESVAFVTDREGVFVIRTARSSAPTRTISKSRPHRWLKETDPWGGGRTDTRGRNALFICICEIRSNV